METHSNILFLNYFISYFWLCWVLVATRVSLVAAIGDYSPAAVPGLLLAVPSLVGEHQL